MNWIALILVNVAWIVCLLIMRRRYRKLLGGALDTLDYVHMNLTPYVGKEGEIRSYVGVALSNLCVDSRIHPQERRRKD
jgi:hypothetical protein